MADMLFKPVPMTLKSLINNVENGSLGLPELQRGYVWKAKKVRDLLDSMMSGYPVGYLMIWASAEDAGKSAQIGLENKAYTEPKSLVIDGQQRLTSLYSAMYGAKITDEKFNEKTIVISFNVFDHTFEVADNATKGSVDWIYDISEVFLNASNNYMYTKKRVEEIADYREKNGLTLSDEEIQTITQNIADLLSLVNYSIPVLEIDKDADEESVADIFVRVNSGGVKLGEDDFILTLISLYWPEGKHRIQNFCQDAKTPEEGTAYNFLFHPSPTHIIRVAMTYGFRRARLHYAYMMLRGRDFDNGVYSDELRDKQFNKLKVVLDQILNIQVWKDFLKCVDAAGFISNNLISSENSLVYTYAFYLIGKNDYGMSASELRKIIPKWFFMSAVTGYYTGSPETDVEADLADLRSVKTKDGFVSFLNEKIDGIFTDDFFNITLPLNLANSSARNPAWLGYCAALNILDAKVLFSDIHTRDLFNPATTGTKTALERHHLFPKAYLAKIGITNDRDRNQTANFAFIEWNDNIDILDTSPAEYMKDQLAKMSADQKEKAYEDHALPDGWENMEYGEFLNQRRVLMAQVIKRGYEQLKKARDL